MKKISILLLTLGVLSICHVHGNQTDSRVHTGWWIWNHNDYAKTGGKHDPRVKWAFEVFKRVMAASDKTEARFPRLVIIDTRGEPYALSVPDGGIIINPITLDTCYGSGRTEGDRRLAFILGHELAHLANNDFLHQETFLALKEHGDKKVQQELSIYFQRSGPEKTKTLKERELLADRRGVLYAAMAGYDMSELFGGKNRFLHDWARQTGIGNFYDEDRTHPSLDKRARFLHTQQLAVVSHLELFQAGVLLYQLGNYHDSAAVFREFSRIYPSREALNNTGACYLSLALGHLHQKYSDDYYRFRLSTAIDYATTATRLSPRGEGDYLKDKDLSRYLDKAENVFRQAAERDALDKACRYNLAAALILKKEYAAALAQCSDILKKDPQDILALNNKAIAFFYYGQEEDLENLPKSLQILENAHRLDPNNVEVLYNLAALKEERKRLAGAKRYWQKYVNLSTTPKDNFYYYVYEKLNGTPPAKPGTTPAPPPMPAGVRLGEDFAHLAKKWGKNHTQEYKVGSEENQNNESWSISLQVLVKDHIRVLALDGVVEIIEREFSPAESISRVLKRYGPPCRIVRHSGGNFYVYESRGFSIKEVAGKACSYTWYETTWQVEPICCAIRLGWFSFISG